MGKVGLQIGVAVLTQPHPHSCGGNGVTSEFFPEFIPEKGGRRPPYLIDVQSDQEVGGFLPNGFQHPLTVILEEFS